MNRNQHIQITCVRFLPVLLLIVIGYGAGISLADEPEWTVVYPRETDIPLHNPLQGWVLIDHAIPGEIDAGRSVAHVKDGTAYEWYQGAAILSTWALVEPQPDTYDWSLMDKAIQYWQSVGKEIHLRFSTEDFGAIPGCPRWLFEMGVPRFDCPNDGTCFPDYTHPVYQDRLKKFMAEFARHFCDHPKIETIDLRAYGNWGEWHSGTNYQTADQRIAALRQLIDIWRQYNDRRKWLVLSVSPEWRTIHNAGMQLLPPGTAIHEFQAPTYYDYLHRSAFDYALAFPEITIRRDGVGGCVDVRYDGRLIATFFQHTRKPLFMEFYGSQKDFRGPSAVGFGQTRPGEDYVEAAVDEMLSHHPNFASPMGWLADGGATDFYNQDFNLVLKGQKYLGYRLVLVRVAYPATVTAGYEFCLYQTWENRAMGRSYRRFPLAVCLMKNNTVVWQGIDPDFDQTNFLSGQSYDIVSRFQLPSDLPPDSYELRLSMVNSDNRPALNLAMEGMDAEKRYGLGDLIVSQEKTQTPSGYSLQTMEVCKEDNRWISRQTLEPDHAYLVSFRYEVTSNPEFDLDTDRPGFFRFLTRGQDSLPGNEVRWFDKAAQPPAFKTCLVTTGNNTDCRLFWEAIGGGTMNVDEVAIQPLEKSQVIEVPVPSQGKGLILAPDVKTHRFDPHRIVAQRDDCQLTLPHDWYDFLTTDPQELPLKPETVYTVWFDCALQPRIGIGDYAYLSVRRNGSDRSEEIAFFRWTQRHSANPLNHAYSFRTGPFDDYQLVWGLKNGGRCELANITILRR